MLLCADSNEPYMKIPCNDSKITSAVWGPLGECIIAGHESGELNQYSAKVRGRCYQVTLGVGEVSPATQGKLRWSQISFSLSLESVRPWVRVLEKQ